MNHRGRRNCETLCEKSFMLVANIIKLSALSVAKMSFEKPESPSSSSSSPPANGDVHAETSSTMAAKGAAAASSTVIWETRRSQEPQNRAKQIYITKPRSEKVSSSLIDGEMRYFDEGNVDGWASKYIEKVHKKNQNDVAEKSKGFLH